MISTDQDVVANLADNLRRAMRKNHMSQEQLEAESGVPQATISRLLNRKTETTVSTIWRIASALETSVDKLLSPPTEKIL
jgi:transcriptional regulator with XRE-family HTH domain